MRLAHDLLEQPTRRRHARLRQRGDAAGVARAYGRRAGGGILGQHQQRQRGEHVAGQVRLEHQVDQRQHAIRRTQLEPIAVHRELGAQRLALVRPLAHGRAEAAHEQRRDQRALQVRLRPAPQQREQVAERRLGGRVGDLVRLRATRDELRAGEQVAAFGLAPEHVVAERAERVGVLERARKRRRTVEILQRDAGDAFAHDRSLTRARGMRSLPRARRRSRVRR